MAGQAQERIRKHIRNGSKQIRMDKTLAEGGKDTESYQDTRDRLERAEALQGIQRGLAEFEQGQGRAAREALEELRAKHGMPS